LKKTICILERKEKEETNNQKQHNVPLFCFEDLPFSKPCNINGITPLIYFMAVFWNYNSRLSKNELFLQHGVPILNITFFE